MKLHIQPTGGDIRDLPGEFLFRHLILSEEEWEAWQAKEGYSKKQIQQHEIDFISVQRCGTVEFARVDPPTSLMFLEECGPWPEDPYFVHDLGVGVYTVRRGDITGLDNLQTYVENSMKGDNLLLLTGIYTGAYTECVWGNGHEGYLVFPSLSPNMYEIEEIKISSFLQTHRI